MAVGEEGFVVGAGLNLPELIIFNEIFVGAGMNLPEEIIFDEILSRLPAQVVIRFKRVCKLWYNTISSPRFVNTHLNKWRSSPSSANLTIVYSPPTLSYFKPPLLRFEGFPLPAGTIRIFEPSFVIMDSCDGLILLIKLSRQHYLDSITYYVWNPVIGSTIKLPPSPSPDPSSKAFLFLDDDVNRYKIVSYIGYTRIMLLDVLSGDTQLTELPFLADDNWDFTIMPMKGHLYCLKIHDTGNFRFESGDCCFIWVFRNHEWIKFYSKKSNNCWICSDSDSLVMPPDDNVVHQIMTRVLFNPVPGSLPGHFNSLLSLE